MENSGDGLRPTDCPGLWSFRRGGNVARHPSELYEALLEGLILLGIMLLAARSKRLRHCFGFLSGLFLFGYAVARGVCELYREPDAFLGYLSFGLTMG